MIVAAHRSKVRYVLLYLKAAKEFRIFFHKGFWGLNSGIETLHMGAAVSYRGDTLGCTSHKIDDAFISTKTATRP